LHTTTGEALLSDFGAASFFDVSNAALARGLEQLDVRALGCLLEELAAQCDATSAEVNQRDALTQLAQQCLSEQPAMRLRLADLCHELVVLV
jgi:hypothetical protein